MKRKVQKWSQKEVDLLKAIFPKKIWSEIYDHFPYRSLKSIKRKAEELKLKRGEWVRFKQMSLSTKIKWSKGCFDTEIMRENCRLLGKKRTQDQRGSKNPNWKGEKSKTKDRRLRVSIESKEWRKGVFQLDNYICQMCGQRGGILEAHHIKGWTKYPELRFKLDNGITLCKRDHKFIRRKEEKYEKMFEKLIRGRKRKSQNSVQDMGA